MAQIAYIDVDDTLVRSAGTKRIPMVASIAHVRKMKEDGWVLYCRSSGGGDYAKDSAKELGIEKCFTGFLPKPDIMIDDVSPEKWPGLKVIHPAELK